MRRGNAKAWLANDGLFEKRIHRDHVAVPRSTTSSLRKQGPITPAVCWSKTRLPSCPERGLGVWVPASAGTTRELTSPRIEQSSSVIPGPCAASTPDAQLRIGESLDSGS